MRDKSPGPLATSGDLERAQRRTLRVLFVAQVASGAGVAAGVTVGALLAAEMLGSTAAAGLPAVLFTLGAGGAAVAMGAISSKYGRRLGLVVGYGAGALGALGVLGAVVLDSVGLLFAALVIYGAGSAANLQARYAGADLAAQDAKGKAAGIVLVATTLGAVAAPQVATASGSLTAQWNVTALAGPFLVASVAYATGAVVLAAWLRPDPLIIARSLSQDDRSRDVAQRDTGHPRWRSRTRTAIVALFGVQAVMIGIMTMTPVHMAGHGHGLHAAATAISLHVAAMYAPAPLSGYLVDRWGSGAVMTLAGVVLAASAGTLAVASGDTVAPVYAGLVLLGLGWSLGVAAGTHVLSTAPPPGARVGLQGRADFFIAAAGAAGGGLAGAIMAGKSFSFLAWVAVGVAAAVAMSSTRLGPRATSSARAA